MIKKYKAFTKTGIMNIFAYKFNIFSWLLVSASSLICLFFLWQAVYNSSMDAVINGYTFKELISYTIIVHIFGFTMIGETMDTISDEIQKGQISMSLIKPISYRLRFTFGAFGALIASNIVIGIPLLTVATIILTVNGFMTITSPGAFLIQIVLFFVAQLFARLLYDVVEYIFGLVSFYTMASFGLNQIREVIINFLSGILIPIAFFPEWAGTIVEYLPFVGMAQNPALIYLGRMSIQDALAALALQAVWIVALELFAHWFFQKAIKIVTIQGG